MTTKFKLIDAHHPQDEPYWDVKMLKKLLSHNCDYTCATSPRSVGKSFSAMTLAKECVDRGENVVWERYNKVELGLALTTWTDFAPYLKKEAIPNGVGWKLIDESSGGHVALIPWNIPQNAKGLDSAYIWEIKDEFIPESYKQKTRIFTEFDDAMSVRKSIIRKYPTRSIYLANAIQWINPYTTNWQLPPVDVGYALKAVQDFSYTSRSSGRTFKDTRTIIWENISMTDAMIERTIHSVAAGARSEAELQAYYDNATKQEYSRIEECPDKSVQLAPLQIMSGDYYMGYRKFDGCLYWTQIRPRPDLEVYVSEPEYIDIGKLHFRDVGLTRQIEQWFNDGRCIFDSPDTLVALQRWLFNNRKRI